MYYLVPRKNIKMKNAILFGLIICLFAACKTDTKKDTPSQPVVEEVATVKDFNVPPMPPDIMKSLYEEVTYIDYIFYELPFSISQDDKPSIHANLQLIAPTKLGPIPNTCKPIGREFFHKGGVIAFEAEIYFQDGCYGYVFLDNEKPIYSNTVSEQGMKFYSNVIAQADQIKNRALNGG